MTKMTIREDDPVRTEQTLTDFLVAQKYKVSKTGEDLNGFPIFLASMKSCEMYVMRASHDGWTRDLIKLFGTDNDQIFTVFRGKIYEKQVNWLVIIGYLQSKIAFRLGLAPRVNSVLAVVAPQTCKADQLPWERLRDF